ncbi:hypothetical protein [Companilactobacillus muriivasis]|uniref:hypothetical protein n=1 Tax=Companilactobacillus muriivasis TaxID=3081444 RepID=UPI0030C7194C
MSKGFGSRRPRIVRRIIAVKCYQAEKIEAYFIDDKAKEVETYNAVNKFYSDKVKFNYHYKSALVADKNEADLVTTRIVPWDDNKDIRLNPHNGICVTKIFSDAFVQGYFELSNQDHMG